MTNELICYKQMPVWTKDKLPKMFQENTIQKWEHGANSQC